jgi:hypothetical protein
MKTAPLQLVRYLVSESSCAANKDFDPAKDYGIRGDLFSVAVDVAPGEAPEGESAGHYWSIELTLAQKLGVNQNFPYAFSATIVGFFTCEEPLPAGISEEQMVRVNGSSILYGITREVIRHLTSSGPWGELMLPTLSFYEADPNRLLSIKLPFPRAIDAKTPKEIRAALLLFYQTLAEMINGAIDGDWGKDENNLREGLNQFIMMHHVQERPAHTQSDNPEHNLFYLWDRARELLKELGVS